jgi:hypothetical protein
MDPLSTAYASPNATPLLSMSMKAFLWDKLALFFSNTTLSKPYSSRTIQVNSLTKREQKITSYFSSRYVSCLIYFFHHRNKYLNTTHNQTFPPWQLPPNVVKNISNDFDSDYYNHAAWAIRHEAHQLMERSIRHAKPLDAFTGQVAALLYHPGGCHGQHCQP